MNVTPEGIPTLASGSHRPGEGKACVMEYVALLAGEQWTDMPDCTHHVLAKSAQRVNDRMQDRNRHLLVPLIGRLFGTSAPEDQVEAKRLNVALAVYSAKSVLHLVNPKNLAKAQERIAVAEHFLATGEKPAYVAADAYAAAYAAADAAAAAYAAAYAYAATYAAAAADARSAAAAAADAYAAAAAAASYNEIWDKRDALAVAGLSALIDEYDRLTGRTESREVTTSELSNLRERVESLAGQR